MAETTLHPPGTAPAAQAVLTMQPPMTQWEALRRIGFIHGFDFVMLFFIFSLWITLGFWKIFANPSTTHLIAGILITIVILQAWIISLTYRCMHNVILVRSDINLMPEEAARLVIAYHSGLPMKPRK